MRKMITSVKILLVDRFKLAEIIAKHEITVLQLVEESGYPTLEAISAASEPGLECTFLGSRTAFTAEQVR